MNCFSEISIIQFEDNLIFGFWPICQKLRHIKVGGKCLMDYPNEVGGFGTNSEVKEIENLPMTKYFHQLIAGIAPLVEYQFCLFIVETVFAALSARNNIKISAQKVLFWNSNEVKENQRIAEREEGELSRDMRSNRVFPERRFASSETAFRWYHHYFDILLRNEPSFFMMLGKLCTWNSGLPFSVF